MQGGADSIRFNIQRAYITDADLADSYISGEIDFSRWNAANTGDIACWGDSLTMNGTNLTALESSYPAILADMIIAENPSSDVWCINKGVGGEDSEEIKDRVIADNGRHMDAIQIFWMGRNGAGVGTGWDETESTAIKAHIADSIAAITSTPKRYLVLGVINGDYPTEYSGETNYNNIVALNDDLATIYGDSFIDVREVLIAEADPVADATDISNDIVPDSLRADAIHLNITGRTIVAQSIYDKLDAKGWLPEEVVLHEVQEIPGSQPILAAQIAFDPALIASALAVVGFAKIRRLFNL
jgi:lysophospholipase L1-like esterase